MLLTEQEAREKWCPHARIHNESYFQSNATGADHLTGSAVNREFGQYDEGGMVRPSIPGATRCIASECMAWRFMATGSYDNEGRFVPDGGHSERGYCGLAGEPR